jgi:flavin-dependent dehydrogenase
MPLNDTAHGVEAPENKDWTPIPEDIYQVVIKDIDEKIMKKFQSEEEDAFYHVKFTILDGEGVAANQQVSCFCARKWFSGNKKMSPSKLVELVKAVYAFYYPKLSVVELEAEDMTIKVINDLIGKQLRVNVKLNAEGTNNKVSDFMAIKKQLPLSEDVKVAAVPKKAVEKPETEAKAEVTEEVEENSPPF